MQFSTLFIKQILLILINKAFLRIYFSVIFDRLFREKILMNLSSEKRYKKASEIIKNIQEHINGIIDIYEQRKLSVQSDMNYFDDANKSLLSLKASLEMYNEQQKKLSNLDIANPQQQLGSFINNLAPNFKETQDAISVAITSLKRQKSELVKHSQKFQSDTSESISQMKNTLKNYFENVAM